MTPNQLRFRASSFKDLSTTNSSDFTLDFWEWILIPKHLQYVKTPPIHPGNEHWGRWLPTNEGLRHQVLKIFTIYPSDLARVSRQVNIFLFLFVFFQRLIGLLQGVSTLLNEVKGTKSKIFLSQEGKSFSSYNRNLLCVCANSLRWKR